MNKLDKAPGSPEWSILEGPSLPDRDYKYGTLAEVLYAAASTDSKITVIEAADEQVVVSYRELLWKAQRAAAQIRQAGLTRGDFAILRSARNQAFLEMFWGCQLAGVVPLYIPPPAGQRLEAAETAKLESAWHALGHPLIVMPEPEAREATSGLPHDAKVLALAEAAEPNPGTGNHPLTSELGRPDDVALLLMTSGSTGTARVVMQTHRALLAYCTGAARANKFTTADISLNWFPLDHVGGLVMFHIRDVFLGIDQVQVKTDVILRQPLRWLDLLERYRASITWAPNFAFVMINSHEREIASRQWDLSSVTFILNGGEAVMSGPALRFLQILAGSRLRSDVMHPAWGMSETCSGTMYASLDPARPADGAIAPVGYPIPGFSARIVDSRGAVVPRGVTGSLEVRGRSVTVGYFGSRQANQEAFTADGWFRTGDLAVVEDSGLRIVGRDKDVIIVNGVNHSFLDIEAAASASELVAPGSCVAVSGRTDKSPTDQLIVLVAPAEGAAAEPRSLRDDVALNVRMRTGLSPHQVIITEREVLPTTSIGKIDRPRLRQLIEAGALPGQEPGPAVPDSPAEGIAWVRLSPGTSGEKAGLERRRIVIISHDEPMAQAIQRSLRLEGHTCEHVALSPDPAGGPGEFTSIRENVRGSLEELAVAADIDDLIVIVPESPGAATVRAASGIEAVTATLQGAALAIDYRPTKVLAVAVTPAEADADRLISTRTAQAALRGLLDSLNAEPGSLTARLVEIAGSHTAERVGQIVVGEIGLSGVPSRTFWRDGHRFVPTIVGDDSHQPAEMAQAGLRSGPTIVIGGLGAVGAMIGEWLLSSGFGPIGVIGKSRLPERDRWPAIAGGAMGSRIRRLEKLEAIGDVTYVTANAARAEELTAAWELIEKKLGSAIRNVVVASGSLGAGSVLDISDRRLADALNGSAEVAGAVITMLEARGQLADTTVVLLSSVNGTFGGAGVGAYAAGCSYIDALVAELCSQNCRAYGLGLSMVRDTGLSQGYSSRAVLERGYAVLDPAIAMRKIESVLSRPPGHWLIGVSVDQAGSGQDSDGGHPRGRQLRAEHVVARITEIWRDILEADECGIDSSFFDLGGHSLLVPRMLERIAKLFEVNLKNVDVFRYPTIRELSNRIVELASKG